MPVAIHPPHYSPCRSGLPALRDFTGDVDRGEAGEYTALTFVLANPLFCPLSLCRFLVLEKGANVNKQDGTGMTPLIRAILNTGVNTTAALRLLVGELGADPNAPDRQGRTALTLVKTASNTAYLLSKGADPNLPGNGGLSPLAYAAESREREGTIPLMLKWGAEAGRRDRQGISVVLYASSNEAYRMLLDAGADPDVLGEGEGEGEEGEEEEGGEGEEEGEGVDPIRSVLRTRQRFHHLVHAGAKGHKKILLALTIRERKGGKTRRKAFSPPTALQPAVPNINQPVGPGEPTPLTAAIRGGHLQVAKMLVAHFGALNLRDGLGDRPWDLLPPGCPPGVREVMKKQFHRGFLADCNSGRLEEVRDYPGDASLSMSDMSDPESRTWFCRLEKTGLKNAVKEGRWGVVELLVNEKGVDLKTHRGKPLIITAANCRGGSAIEGIACLLRLGVSPNVPRGRPLDGRTPQGRHRENSFNTPTEVDEGAYYTWCKEAWGEKGKARGDPGKDAEEADLNSPPFRERESGQSNKWLAAHTLPRNEREEVGQPYVLETFSESDRCTGGQHCRFGRQGSCRLWGRLHPRYRRSAAYSSDSDYSSSDDLFSHLGRRLGGGEQ